MSEYIIEWFDIGGQLANLLNGNIPLVLWPKKIREERLREKIVRCRDCKEYNTVLYQHITCELLERYVKPNDFCSWGVKK